MLRARLGNCGNLRYDARDSTPQYGIYQQQEGEQPNCQRLHNCSLFGERRPTKKLRSQALRILHFMASNQRQQIESLFHAAVKLPSQERVAFLAEACAGDADLCREVEALLAADVSGESATEILSPQVSADGLAQVQAERFTGKRINHYQILSQLGAGGMGEVFLAEDARLQRKVALKLLPAQFTNDRERVRRFEQEARAASALNHPNIITIHDLGESDSGCFIVMEHVAGRTLQALAAEPIALASLLDWGGQVAKALSAAHAANIIHRDIKPANIMVREDGYVKVLDFGLARLSPLRNADWGLGIEEPGNPQSEIRIPQLTMPGTVMGTVKYMSPEQTRGESVTTASDIFAFGIVLYEVATGQHPFIGATLFAVMQAITTNTPFAPSHLNPALPAELNTLLLRMLAKDAAARPSAVVVAATLEAIARGSGSASSHKQSALPNPQSAIRHTVGRAAERAELQAAFLSGRSSLLCVAGEPGIGKTTLVEDWLTELSEAHSCVIARGRCSERLAGTEAYLPLLEALESLLRYSTASSSEPRSMPQLMRQLAPTWYAQVASLSSDDTETQKLLADVKAASQERMKRELAAFLTAVAQSQPLVIFFDDLHWADVSTIDLLNFLAGKFDAMRVLIIVTYRPSDMLLSKHPFLQIRPDLQARGLCRELLLEFLNATEIAEYLALEFPGHRFPPEFPQLIHAKTEGSPLFMADLVRYLRDQSAIANTSGSWTLAQTLPDIERELPESVRGMIERKIAQLSEEDRKLLTAASVQGYEFDSAVLAQVLSLDADETEERLEKLERVFAFVKLTSETEFPNHELTLKYRFVHVLYQNALYGSLRATRRATLSASVAQSLQGFYGEQSHSVAVELANLFEAARDFAKSAEFFAIAAQNAAQVFANVEAITLARRGLNALKTLPADTDRDRQEMEMQLTLGSSLAATTFWAAPEVGEVHRRARELCQQQSGNPQFFQMLTGLWTHHVIRAEMQEASELARRLLQLAEEAQDLFMLEFAHCFSGITMAHLGEFIAAGKHFEAGLNYYRPGQHPPFQSLTVPSVGSASELARNLWILGYPDRALLQARRAYDFADSQSNPSTLGFALLLAALLHQLRREEVACEEKAEAIIALSRERDIADNIIWASFARGWAIARQGRTEEGITQLRESVAIYKSVGAELALAQFLAMTAEAFCCAGQVEEALTTIDEALVVTRRNRNCYYDAELHRWRGELLLLNGATEAEAEACFQQAIEIARQQSAKSWELRAATSLARLWQRQGKITEARQMLAEIYGWFTEGFATADLKDAQALLDELQQPMDAAR